MASQNVKFNSAVANPRFKDVRDVDPKEVSDKREQVMVVDVRNPDEFTGELGHIPGATLMVLDTLPQRLNELPKDKTLVFVCLAGGRSAKATSFALTQGYTDVLNMSGGMQAWNVLGLDVEGRSEA